MRKEESAKLLTVPLALGFMGGEYNDFTTNNEKIQGYTFGLVDEIDRLLYEAYSKEEIISFIKQTDFTKQHPELTEEENDYLKNFALDILDVRYNLYLEHKDDKIEVIEINSKQLEEDIEGQTKSLVKKNNHKKK